MVTPQFGGTDLFEERDVERPRPGAAEVLVRVVAAGTNPVDAKLRANGASAGLEAPIILGADISGVVEEVGPGVTDLAPGEEVYYTPEVFGPRSNGSYAEYHVAKANIVAKKPATLSHEQAAAVPLAGGTAYEAIVRRLAVRVGETILIHGGGRWSRIFRRPDRQGGRCPYPRYGEFRQPGDLDGTWRRRPHRLQESGRDGSCSRRYRWGGGGRRLRGRANRRVAYVTSGSQKAVQPPLELPCVKSCAPIGASS